MAIYKNSHVPPPSMGTLALNPLIIPVMDYGAAQAGLGRDDLNGPNKPVFLQAQLNPQQYLPGDVVTLYWNEVPIQTFSLEQSHFDNNFMGFSVYPDSITEPGGDVYYTVFDQLSGATARSEARSVLVKLSPPGGTDTDPSTPYLNDRLTALTVSPTGDITDPDIAVSVTVAPWDNMAEGDELTIIWNGVRLKQFPLAPGQIGQPLTISIPRDTIIAAGDGSPVTVNYEIRDIVNNYSLVSKPALPTVIVDPNASPAPAVKVAGMPVRLAVQMIPGVVGDIDIGVISDPVRVRIPAYAGKTSSDEILLSWEGVTQAGEPLVYTGTYTVGDGEETIAKDMEVDKDLLTPLAGGSLSISYRVNKLSGATLQSEATAYTVSGSDPVPDEITDDFSTHTGGLIRAGETFSTDYITVMFESGNGRIGFPTPDQVPPDGSAALQLPLFHICYQHPAVQPGTQVVLMDLRRDCSKIEFDIYGCSGKTTIDLLDAAKTSVETKALPAITNYHFTSTATQPIHFIKVTGETDWTEWDNIKMTRRNLARSKRK